METDLGLWSILIAIIGGAIRVSTPFLFVSLGELLTERSGPHQPRPRGHARLRGHVGLWRGLSDRIGLGGRRGGGSWRGRMFGVLHGVICSIPRVNDIAIGIALMLFGMGLAFFFGKPFIQPVAPYLPSIPFGWWSDVPQVRAALDVNVLFLDGAGAGGGDRLDAARDPRGADPARGG
jgi:general nucleoside transport system permease protein